MFSLKSCPQQGQHNTKSVFWDSFCEIMIVARVKVSSCAFAGGKSESSYLVMKYSLEGRDSS